MCEVDGRLRGCALTSSLVGRRHMAGLQRPMEDQKARGSREDIHFYSLCVSWVNDSKLFLFLLPYYFETISPRNLKPTNLATLSGQWFPVSQPWMSPLLAPPPQGGVTEAQLLSWLSHGSERSELSFLNLCSKQFTHRTISCTRLKCFNRNLSV